MQDCRVRKCDEFQQSTHAAGLVEYKLVDQQSQELLYKGIVPLETPGALPAGASVSLAES
jgi:hypothetical protein